MAWQVFARFVQRDGYTFRVKTELRYGVGRKRLLGAVVMFNPGSSRPEHGYDVMAPASLDSTLHTVRAIVEEAYRRDVPAGGYLAVYNLFYLCEPGSGAALAMAANCAWPEDHPMWAQPALPPDVSWVWRAWGAAGNLALQRRVTDWQARLAAHRCVGVPVPGSRAGYYHPAYLRRTCKRRPGLWKEAVSQIAAAIREL